jgi:hypothetical protein
MKWREAWWFVCVVTSWLAPVAGLVCVCADDWKSAATAYFIAHSSYVLRPGQG